MGIAPTSFPILFNEGLVSHKNCRAVAIHSMALPFRSHLCGILSLTAPNSHL